MPTEFNSLSEEKKRQLASALLQYVQRKSAPCLEGESAKGGSGKPSPSYQRREENDTETV